MHEINDLAILFRKHAFTVFRYDMMGYDADIVRAFKTRQDSVCIMQKNGKSGSRKCYVEADGFKGPVLPRNREIVSVGMPVGFFLCDMAGGHFPCKRMPIMAHTKVDMCAVAASDYFPRMPAVLIPVEGKRSIIIRKNCRHP